MKLIILAALVGGLVSGCAAKTAEDFASTLTPKLCLDYLTLQYSAYHKEREQALKARGEDCSAYVDDAVKIRAAEAGKSPGTRVNVTAPSNAPRCPSSYKLEQSAA